MNQRIKTIFADAQQLAPADREELAELLLATIDADPDIENAWGEEAHRRWTDHMQSGEKANDAFAVVEEVRDLLKRRGGE